MRDFCSYNWCIYMEVCTVYMGWESVSYVRMCEHTVQSISIYYTEILLLFFCSLSARHHSWTADSFHPPRNESACVSVCVCVCSPVSFGSRISLSFKYNENILLAYVLHYITVNHKMHCSIEQAPWSNSCTVWLLFHLQPAGVSIVPLFWHCINLSHLDKKGSYGISVYWLQSSI